MQHFLQTPAWAKVRSDSKHKTYTIEGTSLIVSLLPRPFKNVGYIPQVDVTTIDFKALNDFALNHNISHVLIDPANESTLPIELPKNINSSKGLYYRATTILDTGLSEQEMLANFKKKHRYNLKIATEAGVKVTISNSIEDLNTCIDLILKTANRQKYFGRDAAYYRNVYSTLNELGQVQIAIAWNNNIPLVAWMLVTSKDTVYYPYGGSSDEFRELMPAYKLVWDIYLWSKANGFKYFDLWGVELANPEEGFTRFKLGFGGRVVEYAKSFDLVVSPVYYKLFKVANGIRWLLLKAKKSIS